jgi:RND family efflux transporter MFP subunit
MKLSKQALFAIIAIVIVIAVTIYFSVSFNKRPAVSFVAVKQADITQGVSQDGTVVAAQSLSLAFQQGGVVSQVNVADGNVVKQGQVLVALDTKSQSAIVSQAQATLAQAQANLEKTQNGATDANLQVSQAAVATAQTALTNAQTNQTQIAGQQNLIVKNAQLTLFNSNLAAIPAVNNISTVSPVITGAYTGTTTGQYQIKTYSTGSGFHFTASGLETYDGIVSTSPVPLGTMGLFIAFPGTVYTNDQWTISLPNTQGSSYITNYNAYQTALQNQSQATNAAQSAVDSAQAQLNQAQAALQLAQTPARPEDIDTAKAQVEAAQAALQSAEVNLSNAVLTAPIAGTVTSVDTKVGETVSGSSLAPGPDAIQMISNGNFQMDVYLSEADIGKIKVGDNAGVTLDSYGSGVIFPAGVILIDPAATVQNGVSTYKVTLQFNNTDDRIKAGMNANADITDQTHQNVLVIPQSAIITQNNQQFVLVDSGNGKTQQVQIQTGIVGLDGNVEVLSGLSSGQQVATFGNQ